MRTVTINISSIEQAKERTKAAFRGEYQGEFISFISLDLMNKVLTPRRWEIIRAMAGKGPMSLRAIARAIDKDVKNTHTDVHALLNAGVLDRSEAGFEFPYDDINIDIHIEHYLTQEAA